MIQAVNGVSNPIFYKHYVSGTHLTKVFPENIPKNVTDVQFHYNPPLLQGGMIHYLYYVDENMTSDKFDKKYRFKAEWIGHINEYNEKPGLLGGAFSNTPSQYNNENDYIIYLVKSRCDKSGYCNHGNFLLAAFNEKTNEVIFKSEDW